MNNLSYIAPVRCNEGFSENPGIRLMMDCDGFSMKIQMPRKIAKMMDVADFQRFREYAEIDSPEIKKTVRKIPKSNKKASSEAIVFII